MSVYSEEDATLDKARWATCQHYTEDYDYQEIDWPCGEVYGVCLECGAEVVRDVMYYGIDTEWIGDWRLTK